MTEELQPKRKFFKTLPQQLINCPNAFQDEHTQFSPLGSAISPENNFSYSFSMSISSEEDRQRSPGVPVNSSTHYQFSQTTSSEYNKHHSNNSTDISAVTSKDSMSMTISNPTHSQSSTDVMSCCPMISDSQENVELREFAIEVLSDLLVNSFDHSEKEKIISNASVILGQNDQNSLRNKLIFKSTDNEEQRQFTMEVLSDFLSSSFDEYDNNSKSKSKGTVPCNSSKERINTFFTPMSPISTKSDEPATKRIFISPSKNLSKNQTQLKIQMTPNNSILLNQTPVINNSQSSYYKKPIPPQDIFVNLKEYLAANKHIE